MRINHILKLIIQLHNRLRHAIVQTCEKLPTEQIAAIDHEGSDDTIYAIDSICEKILIEFVTEEIAAHTPVILIAEGIEAGQVILPHGTSEDEAEYRIIVDPIDGTRALMYQKRSAWILTGVAPNRGANTNLQDIQLAVQTEIPLAKQYLSDQLWAIRGQGAQVVRHNRLTNAEHIIKIQPATAPTIAHGFAMLSRFFPGARDLIAEIDEEIIRGALGPVQPGKAHCFEDQYISTGGQLYELMAGHDRFNADIRPLLKNELQNRNLTPGITCHPYDICTELIARELGVIITNENGELLRPKLNTSDEVSWVGFANSAIRQQIAPLLEHALRKRKLLAE
ncbi:MAG: inositol monophosphatase [Calditrichaeota bacterium]|nr:MAG: inositol monophosphatase [Calditrichota bacterium]